MLSDNSIVYILYTLFLIIIVPIFLRICASTFTGGDVEAKSPIQNIVQNAAHNEQLDKILDFVLGTILMGMLIVYLIIWPPVLLDVPESVSYTHLDVYKRQDKCIGFYHIGSVYGGEM